MGFQSCETPDKYFKELDVAMRVVQLACSLCQRVQENIIAKTSDRVPSKEDNSPFIGTPYQGGIFFLDITFPSEYPFKPPKVVFKTRIFHCNVDPSGNLGLVILSDSWSPARTISTVLLAIRSIFANPDPYNPVVPGIARLYLTDRAKHDELATEWTLRFAR